MVDSFKNELNIGDYVAYAYGGPGYKHLSFGHIVKLNTKTAKIRCEDEETGKPELNISNNFVDIDVKYFNILRIGEKK